MTYKDVKVSYDPIHCFLEIIKIDYKEFMRRTIGYNTTSDLSFSVTYGDYGVISVKKYNAELYNFKYKGVLYYFPTSILWYIGSNISLRDNFITLYISKIDNINSNNKKLVISAETILYRDFLHITKDEYLLKLSKLKLLVDIQKECRYFARNYFYGNYIDNLSKESKVECYTLRFYNDDVMTIKFGHDNRLIPINVIYFIKDKDDNFLYKYFSALFEGRYERRGSL